MRVFSVANQKGGTAKTSTAHALITGATSKGKRALAIDFDPQGNLSFIMGADANRPGAYELMKQEVTASEAIQHTAQGDIIPASLNLAGADTEFSGKAGRDFFLQAALEPLQSLYDVVVIDTSPRENNALPCTLSNKPSSALSFLISSKPLPSTLFDSSITRLLTAFFSA